MAKEKKELNPEQFNEFLVEVATRVEPVTLGDIFSGKAFKDIRQDMKEDNPLIKSYKNIGSGFINKILRDETDYKFTDEDKGKEDLMTKMDKWIDIVCEKHGIEEIRMQNIIDNQINESVGEII